MRLLAKPTIFSAAVLLFPLFFNNTAYSQNNQDIDEVLTKYVEAMGGMVNLENLQSVRFKGTVRFGEGEEMQITILKKKPSLIRISILKNNRRFIQGFDGETAWVNKGSYDKEHSSLMEEEDRKLFTRDAPLVPPLIDIPENCEIKFEGTERVSGINCYKLSIRYPDNSRRVYFIDQSSYLERKIVEYDSVDKMRHTSIPSEFEKVDGIVFATQFVQWDGESNRTYISLDTIETNIGIFESAFRQD